MPKKIKTYTLDDDVVSGIVSLSAKYHKPQSEIINTYMRAALQKVGVLKADPLQADALDAAASEFIKPMVDELARALSLHYRPANEGETFEVLTATAIGVELWAKCPALRCSTKAIGQKLRSMGFKRMTVRLSETERPTGYKVVRQ